MRLLTFTFVGVLLASSVYLGSRRVIDNLHFLGNTPRITSRAFPEEVSVSPTVNDGTFWTLKITLIDNQTVRQRKQAAKWRVCDSTYEFTSAIQLRLLVQQAETHISACWMDWLFVSNPKEM
ncbi:hypothetical protein EDC04DRAFT_2916665 [Pisolithus marmoratus]|nr:hypothetical protein EDC04DRAFT_2916665 [Pisolithus marmoratus]